MNFPLDKCLFLPSDDLSCYNCHCIPNQPIELTTCHHQLCMGCIKGGLIECPCGSTVLVEHINTASPLTLNLIGSLLIHCNNKDCKEVMELKHLMAHISSSCQHTTVPPPLPSSMLVNCYTNKVKSLSWHLILWILLLRPWSLTVDT